jgi:autotransporter-associated beta strand protein
MNRTYRLVWNRALRVVQVASELASAAGSDAAVVDATPMRRRHLWGALVVAGLCTAISPAFAQVCQPTASSACSAQGGAAINPSAGVGGAGNGMGGGAVSVNTNNFNFGAIQGGQSANGVGGTGATGVDSTSGSTPRGAGGTGGAIGGVPGASPITGARGNDGAADSVSPGGGGGGGSGYYLTTVSLPQAITSTLTGGAGGNGGARLSGIGTGGAGGGGGGAGLVSTADNVALQLTGAGSAITGGAGGNGGGGASAGVSWGGSGGGGGDGVLLFGTGATVTNEGTITGGQGGAGGAGNSGAGNAGASGVGIRALDTGLTLDNSGTVIGGDAVGNGAAGVGVVTQANATLTNSGTLSGGMGTGTAGRASAVLFNGTGNRLQLNTGSTVQGAIELADGASATIATAVASTLDGVKFDSATTNNNIFFNVAASAASIDVGGAITGGGNVAGNGDGSITLGAVNVGGTVTMGQAGGTRTAGTIESGQGQSYFSPVTLDADSTFKSDGGAVTFASTVDGAHAMTATALGALAFQGAVGGNAALTSLTTNSGSLAVGAINAGSVALTTTGGAITSTGPLVVAGASSFNAGANDITLDNAGNLFGGAVSATGKNITLGTGGALSTGAINASGTLSLTTTGTDNITQATGAIVANTLTATTAGDLTLSITANQIANLGNISARDVTLANSAPLVIVGNVAVNSLALSTTAGAVLSGTVTSANGTTINAGSSLTVDASAASGALASDVLDNGQLLWNGANTYTGALTGNGQLLKQGTGALVIDGDASAFTGSTTVSGGSLIVGGATGSTTVLGGTSVAVQGGGTLGGHGTVGGNVTVAAGGAIAPGNSIGTLRIAGDLTLASGSAVDAEFGAGGTSDRVVVGGNLGLNGATLNVADAGGMGHGLYTVFSYAGSSTGALALGATPAGHALALQYDTINHQVNLLDSTTASLSFWNANRLASPTQLGGGSGTWSVTAPNWTDSVGSVTAAMSPQPSFGIFAGAPGTVTVDGSAGQVVANGMQFASDGYQMTGDSVQLVTTDGTVPVIRVGDGSTVGAAYTATLANALAGNQGLDKQDAGTLVLAGNNTYTGGTTITAGKLSVAADNSLGDAANAVNLAGGTLRVTGTTYNATARDLVTNPGGILEIADASNTFNWQGSISGTGALVVQGPGTLELDRANSYTGGTAIAGFANGGTLRIGNSGAIGTGDLYLLTHGRLAFAADGLTLANNINVQSTPDIEVADGQTATLSGNIVAYGPTPAEDVLQKTGAGTLVLTGTDSLAQTTIGAGTLQIGNGGTSGAVSGNIANNGTLVFNRSDYLSYAGEITGGGQVTKLGAGTLELAGSSLNFTGSTTVSAGTLQLDGALGGNLTLASGTTLSGSGVASNVTLQGGSTISPGGQGTIGALGVRGDLTVAPGTQYTLDLDSAGNSDRVLVGGHATLQGGTVVSLGAATRWDPSTTYRILSATGGVSGTFSNVSSNFAFLTPTLAYTANAVDLTLIRNDLLFSDIGVTRNQRSTAGAIEALGEGAPVFDAVVKLDAASARSAYDQLSGEIHANLRGALADDDRFKREAINQHLLTQFADETEDAVAAWASAWGHSGSHDEDGNASKLDTDGSGVFVGADRAIGGQSRIGVALGAGHVKADSHRDSASGNSFTAALYGGGTYGNVVIQAGGLFTRYDIDTHRTVDVDALSGRLSGTMKGHSMQAFVEGAYEFRWDIATLAPFVNLAQQQLRTGSVNERGSDAALHVMGEKSDITYGTVGLRGRIDLAQEGRLAAFGSIGWQHAAGDTDTETHQRFASGGQAFAVAGTPIGKNSGVAVVGLRFLATPTVTIDASYNGQFSGEAKDQSARLGLNWMF